ncbi:putative uncharacterized protein DDB_G0282133 isoform X2 [Condylostylus longicornis]|uniref:putative uncharacterized protein DDB_G0282133 isoform X2 n=1 Tax=Condylostylus longicornis TaxID=2530218 RepID=UPI00244E217A|nr:putative uncharacterized protein DDB_G0282133 isoform X2 [Condylostylus longicornis]
MAPALTEPLSPNNTLTTSTSSASPRPSISKTSTNSLLKNNNHNIKNGNTVNNKNNKPSSSQSTSGSTTDTLLNGHNNNTNTSHKNFGITENSNTSYNNISNNNLQKNNLFRRSLTSTCAFQSAFEESIIKAGISLPSDQQQNKKNKKANTVVVQSIVIKRPSFEGQKQARSNSPNENLRIRDNTFKIYPTIGSKENLSDNFYKKVKTEPLYNQQPHINNNKISPKTNNNFNNSSSNSNNNSNNTGRLTTNGPSSLLSTSSIVCKSIDAKTTSATTSKQKSNRTDKLMGPMSNTTEKDSQDFVIISKDKKSTAQQSQQQKNKNNLEGFIPIDKDFEEAINNTFKINCIKRDNIKQDHRPKREKNEIRTLLRIDDLQQMDLPKHNDNNENIVNISDKSIELSRDNIESEADGNFLSNKRIVELDVDSCGNIISGSTRFDKDVEDSVIIECDSRNQQSDIEFSQQEIRSTGTTDTTVSASEGENNFLDENFQDSSQTICHRQESTPNRLSNLRSPPKTPASSSQHLSQIIGTVTSSILTPQSIGLNSSAMGLQKDFKDSEIDDQVISDMDLLQVLKGLDPTTGGDNLCDLAGNLGLFNDVDVMNYEEIVVPNLKESDTTLDARSSIEKCHQQMERKCEHLLRRLRKLQSRYMAKHISQEISGLFEWTNRLVRRKDQHEQIPCLTYEEDKHRPVSATAMRTLLRRIDSVAKEQHSNPSDLSSQPLKKYKCSSRSTSSSLINSNLLGREHQDKKGSSTSNINTSNVSTTIIKSFDAKTAEEIGYVSGLLHSEVHQTQYAFDSDATASSSGGESADEMVPCNNQSQQPLSISKRAGWKWARDRAAIASRWTWLCTQISDLEYRIRQHNELYQQIRKNKGVVQFEIPNVKYSNEKQKNDTVIAKNITDKKLKVDNSENGTTIMLNSDNITINSKNNVNGYRGIIGSVNNTNHHIENKRNNNNNNNNNNISSSNDNNNNSNSSNDNFNNNIKNIKQNNVHQIDESGNASVITEDEEDEIFGACRTRPFQRSGFRKRKLLQTANVHTVSKKAARPSTVKCGCQWPFNPCALCTGRPDPTAPRDLPDTMMLAERIALLDPGFHPVLSFAEDVPTSIHVEAILQMPEWQNKLIRSVSKNSKSLSRKAGDHSHGGHNKSSGNINSKRSYNKSNQKYRKDSSTTPSTNKIKKSRKNHDYPSGFSHHSGTVQSQQNSSNSSIKNKHRKPSSGTMVSSSLSLNSTTFASSNTALSSSGNRANSSFSALNSNTTSSINGFQSAFAESLINSFQCDNLDGSTNGVLPRSKNTSPTPLSGVNHKHERPLERKNRNSYDIDNIVIPYSVAASTRVELLPYKEIPTPKWRVIDEDAEKTENDLGNDIENNLDVSKNKMIDLLENKYDSNADIELESITRAVFKDNELKNALESQDDLDQDDFSFNINELDEDISIEAIQSRHERALLEERRKFSTYLKFPWSTRSRANRRIDSRAESSGANTPDPTSPAPHTPSVGGDQESIPSPAAPSTPMAVQGESGDGDLLNNTFGHRRERKRTVSSKKDKDVCSTTFSHDRRSQSPDLKEMIPPYEPLRFPISDDLFEKMLQLMPNQNDMEENSNLVSDICETNINNVTNILGSSNTENINRKISGSNNSSRKNSISLNLSDTFSCVYESGTSTDVNDIYRNNNNNRNSINENSINNNNSNKNISKKKSIQKMESSFHEYFDSNDKIFLLPDDSDTDSIESGLDDPNDPEWKEPE